MQLCITGMVVVYNKYGGNKNLQHLHLLKQSVFQSKLLVALDHFLRLA